jgi:hypothetical protein
VGNLMVVVLSFLCKLRRHGCISKHCIQYPSFVPCSSQGAAKYSARTKKRQPVIRAGVSKKGVPGTSVERAEGKVVAILRDTAKEKKSKNCLVPAVSPRKSGDSSKSFVLLASPTGFEPVLPS